MKQTIILQRLYKLAHETWWLGDYSPLNMVTLGGPCTEHRGCERFPCWTLLSFFGQLSLLEAMHQCTNGSNFWAFIQDPQGWQWGMSIPFTWYLESGFSQHVTIHIFFSWGKRPGRFDRYLSFAESNLYEITKLNHTSLLCPQGAFTWSTFTHLLIKLLNVISLLGVTLPAPQWTYE